MPRLAPWNWCAVPHTLAGLIYLESVGLQELLAATALPYVKQKPVKPFDQYQFTSGVQAQCSHIKSEWSGLFSGG